MKNFEFTEGTPENEAQKEPSKIWDDFHLIFDLCFDENNIWVPDDTIIIDGKAVDPETSSENGIPLQTSFFNFQ